MRKLVVLFSLIALVAGALLSASCGRNSEAQAQQTSSGQGGRGGSSLARPPMTVELAKVAKGTVSDRIMVVGSLIGAATVEVVPKLSGRLQSVMVRIGDPVRRGQLIAKVEDREIQEQVRQAQASNEVGKATIRQREADLKFAQTNLERSRSLFARDLVAKQTLDDAEARYQAAVAQLDLARAQFDQAGSRLDELNLNLANTNIISPVDGFVGRRNLDPGAYIGPNSPVVSVVDISFVRLVANLVEKDLRRVNLNMPADVDVDAYPGEKFMGRVARLAPVLDPNTRTAQMEVEVQNPGFRLKPGMYARVQFTVTRHEDVPVIPRNALVDIEGKRGVFFATGGTAQFREVTTGLQEQDTVEIVKGVSEGDMVVTTGAPALRDGDRILLPGQTAVGGAGGGRGGSGRQGQTGGQGSRGATRPGGGQ